MFLPISLALTISLQGSVCCLCRTASQFMVSTTPWLLASVISPPLFVILVLEVVVAFWVWLISGLPQSHLLGLLSFFLSLCKWIPYWISLGELPSWRLLVITLYILSFSFTNNKKIYWKYTPLAGHSEWYNGAVIKSMSSGVRFSCLQILDPSLIRCITLSTVSTCLYSLCLSFPFVSSEH